LFLRPKGKTSRVSERRIGEMVRERGMEKGERGMEKGEIRIMSQNN
jgi:hypothetical protein